MWFVAAVVSDCVITGCLIWSLVSDLIQRERVGRD